MSQKPRGGSRYTAKAPASEATPAAAEPETEELVPAAVMAAEIEPIEPLPATPPPVETLSSEVAEAPVETIAAAIAAPEQETAEPAATIDIPPATPPLKGIATMMKSTEDFVAFGQANLEAFVKSGQIWSEGMQELTKQFATTAKASFDESVSTFKALSTVKSVKEAIELQSAFAKTSLEKAMAESNKLTDASIKLTEQAIAPIAARVTSAVETFGKAA